MSDHDLGAVAGTVDYLPGFQAVLEKMAAWHASNEHPAGTITEVLPLAQSQVVSAAIQCREWDSGPERVNRERLAAAGLLVPERPDPELADVVRVILSRGSGSAAELKVLKAEAREVWQRLRHSFKHRSLVWN